MYFVRVRVQVEVFRFGACKPLYSPLHIARPCARWQSAHPDAVPPSAAEEPGWGCN